MDKGRLESRRKDFKKNFEDPRRRREDATVQIRKTAREHQVSQKRAMLSTVPSTPPSMSIESAVAFAFSNDLEKHLIATQQFRKLLAVDENPPIQQVVDTNIVPRLIEFLRDGSRPDLQLEAAWTITNIASGTKEQTKIVTDNGAIPIFVELLSSPKEDVRDQAVWALGNIAGDCTNCRDMVIEAGALEPLLTQIKENKKLSMSRNAAWALSNLCRGSPQPQFCRVEPALPTLRQLIYTNDPEILTDTCWALSYLLDTRNEKQIDKILSHGFCVRLVDLLTHGNQAIQNPALRSVGQIIAGTNLQTEVVIAAGVLNPLRMLLSSPKPAIRKEACWVLSNIAAGTTQQVQMLLNNQLIEPLIQHLSTGELDVKRECAWALSNAIIGGSVQQIARIVELGCIQPLCDLLALTEVGVVQIALEALDCILLVGNKAKEDGNMPENPYVRLVEEADGCSKLERLQLSDINSQIYRQTIGIMTNYFQTEEDGEGFGDDPKSPPGGSSSSGGGGGGGFGVSIPQGGFGFGGSLAPQQSAL